MTGTKRNYIGLTAFILCLLAFYTSQAQTKLICDETELKQANKQTYIETVNSKIAYLAIKELKIKRYSKQLNKYTDTVYRLSIKRSDTLAVLNWFSTLERRKIDLRRK